MVKTSVTASGDIPIELTTTDGAHIRAPLTALFAVVLRHFSLAVALVIPYSPRTVFTEVRAAPREWIRLRNGSLGPIAFVFTVPDMPYELVLFEQPS